MTARRDQLAATIRSALDAVEFRGGRLDKHQARRWIERAEELIEEAGELTRD